MSHDLSSLGKHCFILISVLLSGLSPTSAKETPKDAKPHTCIEKQKEKPTHSDYYWRGVEQSRKKNYKEALIAIKKARKMAPNNTSYAIYLGWLYIEHFEDAEKALPHLEMVRRKEPKKEQLWINLAKTYKKLERWHNASVAYAKAAEQELSKKKPNIDLATFYEFQSGIMNSHVEVNHDCLVQLKKAWKKQPEPYKNYMNRTYGSMLYKQARIELSGKNYKKSNNYFKLLNEFISTSKMTEDEVIKAFPFRIYGINYIEIIETLRNREKKTEHIQVPVLSILPNSLESNKTALEELLLARKLFVLLIDYLSEGQLKLVFTDCFVEENEYKVFIIKSSTITEDWENLEVVNARLTAEIIFPLLEKEALKIPDFDFILLHFDASTNPEIRPSASVLYSQHFKKEFLERKKMGLISMPLHYYSNSEGVYVHEYLHLLENL